MTASVAPDGAGCRAGCPRHAALGPVLAGVGWLGGLVAALGVAAVPYDGGESLCGPWGCLPPLPPLAALHLGWAVVLAAGVWAARRWRPCLVRPLGVVLVAGAAAVAVLVVGRDVFEWVERMPEEWHHFWPRRAAYTVATATDWPLLQAAAAGVACLLVGRPRAAGTDIPPGPAGG